MKSMESGSTEPAGTELAKFNSRYAVDTLWGKLDEPSDDYDADEDIWDDDDVYDDPSHRYEEDEGTNDAHYGILPHPATVYALYDMKSRYENGGQLNGHDLAVLYSYKRDEHGVFYDSGDALNVGMVHFAREMRDSNRYIDKSTYRYNDHIAIAEALGTTVGDLVRASSDARIIEHGDFQYFRHMEVVLGKDDTEDLDDPNCSYNRFFADDTIDVKYLLASMNVAAQIGNAQYFLDTRGHILDLDKVAFQVENSSFGKWEIANLIESLPVILKENPDFTLGDLSHVAGVKIEELLQDEAISKIFGDGAIIDGESDNISSRILELV